MRKITEIPKNDKPREKLATKGVEALSSKELLIVILGKGIKGRDVTVLAIAILKLIENERENVTLEKLQKVQGVGKARAGQILASFELAKRHLLKPEQKINNTEDVLILVSDIRKRKQEYFITITLTGASNVIKKRTVFKGTINYSVVHPREIFCDALTDRAAGIIFVHNHPENDVEPSANPDQADSNQNGVGDACDTVAIADADGDGIADDIDNCPNNANENQADNDQNGIGDVCDPDIDGDGIANESDNCPNTFNPDQLDFDSNDVGDVCDSHTYTRLFNPESVVRYKDYYLVSNLGVALDPDTPDGDGTISVINVDGSGLIQDFITGLDSPKGLKIINDLLYVCDLTHLKVFNIETQVMIQSFSFQDEGVTLLNDITDLDFDGETVYVTATRTNRIFKINIFSGEKEEVVVEGVTLKQTNGLALDTANNLLYMVELGESDGSGARIVKIDLEDNSGQLLGGGTTGLLYDGVALVDTTLYVSDWSHRLFSLDLTDPNSTPTQLQPNLNGPADILYDSEFNRIVIPSVTAHEIVFYDL